MRKIINQMMAVMLLLTGVNVGMAMGNGDVDIVTYLNDKTGGQVTVIAPDQLKERLKPENGDPNNGVPRKAVSSNVGYRIQVFSGNSATAKREAHVRERNDSCGRQNQLMCYTKEKNTTFAPLLRCEGRFVI